MLGRVVWVSRRDACGTSRKSGSGPRYPRAGAAGYPPGAACVESTGVGDGNCYFVDSTHSNSWRQLRQVMCWQPWSFWIATPHVGLGHRRQDSPISAWLSGWLSDWVSD